MPHPQPNRRGVGGGVHSAFGVHPVGVGVASCLHSISWTSGWILTMLDTLWGGEVGGGSD